jgi:hypothetical protein
LIDGHQLSGFNISCHQNGTYGGRQFENVLGMSELIKNMKQLKIRIFLGEHK